jgi:ribosome biogenesis GTPase A
MRDKPMSVDRALAILGDLHDCLPFQSMSDHTNTIAELVEQTKHGLSATRRPFRILVVGGTGVGKSTLLNAFAGATIAKTGPRRPTTDGFTVYIHEEETDPWLNTLHKVRISTHRRKELRGKAIIDSPDVDSVVSEHRRILEEALGLVDMVLVVVTAEKYVSESVIRLIDRFRAGRWFAFVFNKRDLYPEGELPEDLETFLKNNRDRPEAVNTAKAELKNDRSASTITGEIYKDRIFHISARFAYEARIAGEDETEEFGELEEWIGEKLHHHTMAEIVRMNLGQRMETVTGFVRRVLPATWKTMDDEWRNGCAVRFSNYLRELSDVLQRDLFRIQDIAETIAGIRGSSFGGFYGIISDVVYAAYTFRRSRLLPRMDGADQWVRARMSQEEWERFDSRDRFVYTSCIQFGKNLGISEPFLQENFVQSWEQTEVVGDWLRSRCVEGIARNLEAESTPPGLLFNVIANSPSFFWFGYWIYRIVQAVLHGESPPWDAIPGAAIILGFFLMFQWWLTNRFLKWEAKRRARRLISSILSSIEARYLKHRESAVESVTAALRKCIDRYQRALNTLGRNDDL